MTDFRALNIKLASGKPLSVAAVEAGMTEDEARAYLENRETEDDESLRAFADEALRVSLFTLKRAAKAGMRQTRLSELGQLTTCESTDVQAATALLNAAMKARAMLRKKAVDPKKDLFDSKSSAPTDTAWTFKTPD